jgi:hypothetical protein
MTFDRNEWKNSLNIEHSKHNFVEIWYIFPFDFPSLSICAEVTDKPIVNIELHPVLKFELKTITSNKPVNGPWW